MGWLREQFSRRRYVVEGDTLDKAKKIEVIVRVDGRQLVCMQAREPGIVAMVSKPDDQGFEIDVVEPTAGRYVDRSAPSEVEQVAGWQYEALGLSNG